MKSARVWILSMSLAAIVVTPLPGQAQPLGEPIALSLGAGGAQVPAPLERWEFTIGGRVGAPIGHLQVGEFHGGQGTVGAAPGTRLSLNTLGIHVSEAVEASVAFHFTENDAVRFSGLYYFLRGDSTPTQSVVYNGEEFKPGPLHTNADFARLDLAYERRLWRSRR